MRPPLRILDTGQKPAHWNVAMTAALAELHASGDTCDTVRFHRYPACVLLGAGQDIACAADAEYCQQAGIAIARRVTGGGAVYMSPRMLAWDVVVERAAGGGDLQGVAHRVCTGVAAGLSRLGVKARFRAPNDVEIGGRKVSGSSGYAAGHSAVLQGTVLVQDDVPAMARSLRLPEALLREHVTSLEAEAGAAPAFSAIMQGIIAGLARSLGCEPVRADARPSELALCETLLRAEIGTDAYVTGSSAVPDEGRTCRAGY